MTKCGPSMVANQDAHCLVNDFKKADLRVLLFLEQLHPMSSVKSKSAFASERPLAHMAPARRAGTVSVLSGVFM